MQSLGIHTTKHIYLLWDDITKHMSPLGIPLGARMNTSGVKRGRVITSGNLAELLQRKDSWDSPGRPLDSKRDFLWALAGGITPQQSASIHWIFTRNTQESHKNPTRITLEFHKNHTRITTQSYLPLDMQMWHAKRKCSSNGARVMECFSQSNDHSGIQSFYLPSHQPIKKGN